MVLVSAVVGTIVVVAVVGPVVFVTTCKDDPVMVLFGVTATLRIAAENALEAIKILEEALLSIVDVPFWTIVEEGSLIVLF